MHKFLMKLARLYLARRVRRRPPRPLSGLDPGGIRRVLLISNTALGDTLFSTPAIRALKERYPTGNWRSWPTGYSGISWPIIPMWAGFIPTPAATGAS